MKNIRKVIYALIVLNLVVDAAFLVLAPDQVAVHFGASGEADRIGASTSIYGFPRWRSRSAWGFRSSRNEATRTTATSS